MNSIGRSLDAPLGSTGLKGDKGSKAAPHIVQTGSSNHSNSKRCCSSGTCSHSTSSTPRHDQHGRSQQHQLRAANVKHSTEEEEGPSELTLVFYSVFMAFSSLLFGGLSLWHARQDNGSGLLEDVSAQMQRYLQWHHIAFYQVSNTLQSVDPRTFAWLMSTLCLLVLLGEWMGSLLHTFE
jgi:hypothetical protein